MERLFWLFQTKPQVKDGKILAAFPSLHLRPHPREILAPLAPSPEPGVRQHDPQTKPTAYLDELVVHHQGIKTAMTKVPPAACVFVHSYRPWRRKCRTELENFQIRSRQRCWRSSASWTSHPGTLYEQAAATVQLESPAAHQHCEQHAVERKHE